MNDEEKLSEIRHVFEDRREFLRGTQIKFLFNTIDQLKQDNEALERSRKGHMKLALHKGRQLNTAVQAIRNFVKCCPRCHGTGRVMIISPLPQVANEIINCTECAWAREAIQAIYSMDNPTHQHITTGGLYRELGRVKFKSGQLDSAECVLYEDQDGRQFVRTAENFHSSFRDLNESKGIEDGETT